MVTIDLILISFKISINLYVFKIRKPFRVENLNAVRLAITWCFMEIVFVEGKETYIVLVNY